MIEDVFVHIDVVGISYKVVKKTENWARIRLAPEDVPTFKSMFVGEHPYRNTSGQQVFASVSFIAGTLFDIKVSN